MIRNHPRLNPRRIERMAQVMAEREASTGACTQHDLTAAGFTPAEIESAAASAAALARDISTRRITCATRMA